MPDLCDCTQHRVLPFTVAVTLSAIHARVLWNRLMRGYTELVAKVQEAMHHSETSVPWYISYTEAL